MRKMRSCFRSPEVLEMFSPSANICSSATDFRFSSAISTGEDPGDCGSRRPGARHATGGKRNDARKEACGGIRRPPSEEEWLGRGKSKRQAIEARWEGQVRCPAASERDVAEWAAFDV